MNHLLVDTGPLVAILSSADQHHAICVETLKTISQPLYSCWPVITEAVWLLRAQPNAVRRLLRGIGSGWLHLLPIEDREVERIARILEIYESLRPQLADAALVYLAERERVHTIFTLDRRDFSVYQTFRNRPFQILPEQTK